MANEIFFFATKEDLLSIVRNVEQMIHLKYVQAKAYDSKNIKIYESLEDYNEIGINKSGNHQSENFLVLESDDELILREVQQLGGSNKYYVDQMKNQNSVLLWPGGIYEMDYLICGHIGTIHTSTNSKKIFNMYKKYIRLICKKKVGKYYISNNAMNLFNELRFITINVNQSKEYDLKL